MTVTQTSPKAIINWQGFDIGAQASVTFNQPDAAAAALNRVLTATPSQIYGKLSANGQVFLVNPAGITFGPGSTVNAGALVAATMDIKDADFLAGTLTFQRNGSTGIVRNLGSLTAAPGGFIGLLAPTVANDGLVTAHLGTVVLAAGEVVTLSFGGGVTVQVDPATIATLIQNHNLIAAPGGEVVMSAQAAATLAGQVINDGGIIDANALVIGTDGAAGSLKVDAASRVTLGAGGVAINGAPYTLITTTDQLTAVTGNPGGNYALGADLDLAAFSNFVPIGGGSASFSGNFEGLGHVISGLTISQRSGLGLFASNGGRINDVNLTGVSVEGAAAVGGLAGSNAGAITNSTVSGTIRATGGPFGIGGGIGGLVGVNDGTIGASRMAGTVTGGIGIDVTGGLVGQNRGAIIGSTADVAVTLGQSAGVGAACPSPTCGVAASFFNGIGGLVGLNQGTISGGTATGSVTVGTQSALVGGLVGRNLGKIDNSLATVAVSSGASSSAVGGLVGENGGTYATFFNPQPVPYPGTILNAAATGAVTAGAAGGLAGINDLGTITAVYASGPVTGGSVGGLIGTNNATLVSGYWDKDTSGQTAGIGAGSSAGATGLTTAQALRSASYAGFDFAGAWTIVNGYTRPLLTALWSSNIRTPYQLELIATRPDADYIVSRDIDLGAASLGGAAGFWPSGNFGQISLLRGMVDGKSHRIAHLTDHALPGDTGGLFGINEGVIIDLHLTDMTVSAQSFFPVPIAFVAATAGGLATFNAGTIVRSSGAGTVSGDEGYRIGGLVATNSGTITDSAAFGTVMAGNASNLVGGLVGWNSGRITGSHSSVAVKLGDGASGFAPCFTPGSCANIAHLHGVGGLAGLNQGVVAQSLADGSVQAGIESTEVGGLVGRNLGIITGSLSTASVAAGDGSSHVGDLVGANGFIRESFLGNLLFPGMITGSRAGGAVSAGTGSVGIGGLAGGNEVGSIVNSQSTAAVAAASGSSAIGGLAGENFAQITDSTAGGPVVTGAGTGSVGGLVGLNGVFYSPSFSFPPLSLSGRIDRGAATGAVTVDLYGYDVGGLVGRNAGTIDASSAQAAVAGGGWTVNMGGFVGRNDALITGSRSGGSVTGTPSSKDNGGFAGFNNGTITTSISATTVTGGNYIGGFVGFNAGTIDQSQATGAVMGGPGSIYVGPFFGLNLGTITGQ